MRKLPILLLALASTSLLSCDGKEASASTTGSEKEAVSIAPRIVRSAAISDSLWNATATVFAMLYDSNDSLIPGTLSSAPFGTGRITLPAIDADLVVSVYVSGQNAAGKKIWHGWTDWMQARQFSTGVGIGSGVLIFPSTTTPTVLPSDSLVGTWTLVRDYTGTDGLNYREVNALVVDANGTYTINSVSKLLSGTLYFYGYFESGSWSSPQHQLTVTPVSYEECTDLTTGCDVQIGESSSLYYVEATPNARRFSWAISAGKLYMQDLDNSLNSQIWSAKTN